MTPAYADVAVQFASALVDGDFVRAQQFLTPELRTVLSPGTLREKLLEMFRGYADGAPTRVRFDQEFSSDSWPAKQPGDLGWAYVGIEGDDFTEAVTVTVASIGGQPLIRHVEWGRP
jgi:hypothetical protein